MGKVATKGKKEGPGSKRYPAASTASEKGKKKKKVVPGCSKKAKIRPGLGDR
jgi:hypothetical protein